MTPALLILASLSLNPAVHDQQAFERKLEEVRIQVGGDFHVAIEKPFIVASDQSERDFQRSRISTIRWSLKMLKKDFFEKDPEHILTIYLFDGKTSYHKNVKALFNEEPDTPYGYYSSFHRALIMNIATGGGTLVHEIVHPYTEANFPKCPPWFYEGLGSLFEACRQRNDHIVGTINWRLKELNEGILNGHFVPLKTLLAADSQTFYDDPHGMHYAEARYLLYFLQEKGKLREYYRQFVEHAGGDPSGMRTLLRVLSAPSIEHLEKEWLAFVETLSERR